MKEQRSIFVHLGLLVVAAVFALVVWTRDKKPAQAAQLDVTVWSGKAADVQRITYEGKNKKLVIESKKDDAGRYFVGTMEKDSAAPKAPPTPGEERDPDEAPGAMTHTSTPLFSVGNAEKLAEGLAPLRAFRNVGRIEGDRAAEFGLAEPEGTLAVTVGGTERKLLVGGPTPGGSDRYVRDAATNEVYAIKGDTIRDLESGDQRLVEKDLHEWKDTEVTTAKVIAGGKTRELVRGGAEGKKFWADPKTPDQNEETLGNWMSKVDRMRPTDYAPAPAGGREPVVRIEYKVTSSAKPSFLELVKVPSASGKPDYFIQTERIRQLAKVTQSFGEQVDQDVGSIVK
jgi:hypothetical protein